MHMVGFPHMFQYKLRKDKVDCKVYIACNSCTFYIKAYSEQVNKHHYIKWYIEVNIVVSWKEYHSLT